MRAFLIAEGKHRAPNMPFVKKVAPWRQRKLRKCYCIAWWQDNAMNLVSADQHLTNLKRAVKNLLHPSSEEEVKNLALCQYDHAIIHGLWDRQLFVKAVPYPNVWAYLWDRLEKSSTMAVNGDMQLFGGYVQSNEVFCPSRWQGLS